MKKLICILLCLSMLGLAACGASAPAAPGQAELSKTAYESFLKGESKVAFYYGENDQKDEYTIKELGEALCKDASYNDNKSYISDMQYAYIDCGDDGIPELAVDYEVTTQYEDFYPESATQRYVIKLTDGELQGLWYGETYYRTETSINDCGYIISGGSYSAMGHYFEHSYLTEDLEQIFLYSADHETGFTEPVISRYDIDYLDLPEDYQYESSFEDNGYEVDSYNFTEYMYGDDYNYDEYRANSMYVFLDANGNDAAVPERWRDFYRENGIEIYTDKEMSAKIAEHEKSLGVTDTIRSGHKDPEWTKLEFDWIKPIELPGTEANYSREYLMDEWFLQAIYTDYDVQTPADTQDLDSTLTFIQGPDTPLAYFTYNNPTDSRGAYLLTEMKVYDSDGLEYPAEGELHVEFMADEIDGEISRFTANIDHDDGSLWVQWYWWPEGNEGDDPMITTFKYVKAVG